MTDLSDAPDKELRKAWLKHKFTSFEYHEELLRLHAQWYELVRQALERPEVQRNYPDLYKSFHKNYFPIFDFVSKPGELDSKKWEPGVTAGDARVIKDYANLMYPDYWEWMTDAEREASKALWLKMSKMCLNIRQTVDGLWFNLRKGNDDSILNDKYTGPINWPPNWNRGVPSGAAQQPESRPQSVPGGQPCPRTGWWFTPAEKNGRRRYFKHGDTFPLIEGSSYGDTFWQWSPDQTDPKL